MKRKSSKERSTAFQKEACGEFETEEFSFMDRIVDQTVYFGMVIPGTDYGPFHFTYTNPLCEAKKNPVISEGDIVSALRSFFLWG